MTDEGDAIGVLGAAHVVLTPSGGTAAEDEEARADPRPFLRVPKNKKYMGVQDDLAVVAAGRALASAGLEGAGLGGTGLGARTGLYLAVGYIPFFESDFERVLEASVEDGRFSMERFAAGGYGRASPLLTFRCLPNMPAYHVSTNFRVEGPYFVSYPTAGQLVTALEEASFALREGRIDRALVGGVACQRNFLVEHHVRRTGEDVEALRDAAAFVVLARGAGRARLASVAQRYAAFDPREGIPPWAESVVLDGKSETLARALGPASPLWVLSRGLARGARRIEHALRVGDGTHSVVAWDCG